MNKLYILICAIVLSGCGRIITAEQINKAEIYCKNNNSELVVGYSAFDNKKFKDVRSVACGYNGFGHAIPSEALK